LIGSLLAGALADYFGRKKVLVAFWTGNMLTQASLSLTTSWEMYFCVRVCVGVFSGRFDMEQKAIIFANQVHIHANLCSHANTNPMTS
jgi:MFS family permease